MDRNSIIGLIIIGLILFGFSWYGSNKEKGIREERARLDSISRVERAKMEEQRAAWQPQDTLRQVTSVQIDSLQKAAAQQRQQASLGDYLYRSLQGEEQFQTVENDRMKLIFSNKGARVASVELKNYTTYGGDPLILFHKETSLFDLSFFTNQQISTSKFYFTPASVLERVTSEGDVQTVSFRLHADSLSYVEYVYTIHPNSYKIGFNVNLVGMQHLMNPSQPDLGFTWENVSPQQERSFEYENNQTTVAFLHPGERSRNELGFSTGNKEETINSKIRWVAFKQQFFSSIFLAEDNFQNGSVRFETQQPESGNIKKFTTHLTVPYTPQTNSYNFSFYFGPNSYPQLRQYGEQFQSLIPLGWGIFGWINRLLIIPTFHFLSKFISNYGVIILLLTIFIKLLIFPFTYKSYLSMAKMRLLKPDIDKISEKYPKKEDAMKKQQATMDLYRSAGVSPMGGCLPTLFQLPVLFAMIRFFPASIELRQQSFLWANDLSSYDSILSLPFSIPFYGDHVSLFALLMGISMFFSSKLGMAQTDMSSSTQMPGMKFMSLYIFPVMMVLWFNNYSSGLSYYFFLSNLITIGQTYLIRRNVSDAKLHAQMKANAKKPKKKSKWQQRYDQMMKQQQEMAKNQKKK